MCFYQLYKCREIIEVKWIDGNSNPANLMIKGKASTALKKLIDINYLELQTMEWVVRKEVGQGRRSAYIDVQTAQLQDTGFPAFKELPVSEYIRFTYHMLCT